MGAMEQLLIREFGDMLAELTNHLERRESGLSMIEKHGVEDLETLIRAYLEKLGIARDVKVKRLEAIEKYGKLLERFKVNAFFLKKEGDPLVVIVEEIHPLKH